MKRFILAALLFFCLASGKATADDIFLTESEAYLNNYPSVTSLPTATNDPRFSIQWYLKNTGQTINSSGGAITGVKGVDISVGGAWERNYFGRGVKVAVVDTGANTNHIDLQNQFLNSGRNWNFLDGNTNVLNESSHGSFVSGIIGAERNNSIGIAGIAPESLLYIYKAGSNDSLSTSAIASAFNRSGQEGVSVVNGSFGGGYSREIERAILNNPNVLFVFSAGNESRNNDIAPSYPCSLPAENIVCVTATDSSDRMSRFANFGRRTVDVAAPGSNIISTYIGNSYAMGDGTSFSSPIVAAVAAIIKEKHPGFTTTQLKQALLRSGDVVPALENKTVTGLRINAEKAALVTKTPPPTFSISVSAVKDAGRYSFGDSASFKFKSKKGVRFECRLGEGGTWSGCGRNLRIKKGDLTPGRYRLYVRAVAPGGTLSNEKIIDFSISYKKPKITQLDSAKTVSGFRFRIKTEGTKKCYFKNGSWKRFNCQKIKTGKRSVKIKVVAKNRLNNYSRVIFVAGR